MHFGFDGPRCRRQVRRPVDAVVHFAAIPRILMRPDNAMFAANVLSTYNVIEAATKLGIRKVIIASSDNGLRRLLCGGRPGFHELSGRRGLRRRSDRQLRPFQAGGRKDRSILRVPHWRRHLCASDRRRHRAADYERFPAALADPLARKRDAWSYIDVRDLAQIVDLCLEKDGLGFQVFNATNDEIIANEPTMSFLAKHAPHTPDSARTGGVRGPDVQSKGARAVGLPRGAQLAKIRSRS